jgi:hypothetical protein
MENIPVNKCLYALLLYSGICFAAEPQEAKVFIRNEHPTLQFECKYTLDGTERTVVIHSTQVYLL